MARPGTADPRAYAERWSALKNIPPFLAMIWRASPGLTAIMVALRLIRALVPVAMLWIGKLIIDEVVRLTGLPDAPASLTGWWSSGLAMPLIWLVTAELALALGSDIIGRLVSYTDSMLQEKLVIFLSLRLMDHAASLGSGHVRGSRLSGPAGPRAQADHGTHPHPQPGDAAIAGQRHGDQLRHRADRL